MWERFAEQLRGSSTQTQTATEREADIRRQLAELERQTVAFHEAIGLLRATLSIASQQEQEGRDRLFHIAEMTTTKRPDSALKTSLALTQEVATESWRHDRLYAHTLRQLYHRLLEAKRRFLFQWHQHLMRQVKQLPEQRQAPMTALLENSLQGILAVGVGQIETSYRHDLEKMLEQTHAPFKTDENETVSHPTRHDVLANIEQLASELADQLKDKPREAKQVVVSHAHDKHAHDKHSHDKHSHDKHSYDEYSHENNEDLEIT